MCVSGRWKVGLSVGMLVMWGSRLNGGGTRLAISAGVEMARWGRSGTSCGCGWLLCVLLELVVVAGETGGGLGGRELVLASGRTTYALVISLSVSSRLLATVSGVIPGDPQTQSSERRG